MSGPGWLMGVGMENSQLSCRVGGQDKGNVAGALLAGRSFLSSEAWGAWLGACCPWELLWKPVMGPVSAGGDITTHGAVAGCQGPCGSTHPGHGHVHTAQGRTVGPCVVSLRKGLPAGEDLTADPVVAGVSPALLGWGGRGVLLPWLDCVSLDDGTQGSSWIDGPPQARAPGRL